MLVPKRKKEVPKRIPRRTLKNLWHLKETQFKRPRP
jgi:hypothetical protein